MKCLTKRVVLLALLVANLGSVTSVTAEVADPAYRDGVLGGLNWHAALLYQYNHDEESKYVIHSRGTAYNPESVRIDDWDGFLDGNSAVGTRTEENPNASIRASIIDDALDQLNAHYWIVGTWVWMTPNSAPTNGSGYFRCDALVEWCYEQNGIDICDNTALYWGGPYHQFMEMEWSVETLPTGVTMTYPSSQNQSSPTITGSDIVTLQATGTDSPSGLAYQSPFEYRFRKYVGGSWTTPAVLGKGGSSLGVQLVSQNVLYEFWVYCFDNSGNGEVSAHYYLKWVPSGQPGSYLSLDSRRWDDDTGDDDDVIEGNENVTLRIRLRSSASVQLVGGVLSSSLGDMDITDDTEDFPDIAAGDSEWCEGQYNMHLDRVSYSDVPFNLHVEYEKSGLTYYQDFPFDKDFYEDGQFAASFTVGNITIDDSTSVASYNNGDGIIQSGERIRIRPELENTGSAQATDIDAWLVYTGTAFSVNSGDVEGYPDLGPGNSAYPSGSSTYNIDSIRRDFSGCEYVDMHVEFDQSPSTFVIDDGVQLCVQPAAWIFVEPDDWNFGISPTTSNVVKSVAIRNAGSAAMQVTGLTPSHPDTTWNDPASEPLPWTINAGETKVVDITIATSNLHGSIGRSVVVQSSARVCHAGQDDRIFVSGLVSDAVPVFDVPGVSSFDRPDIGGHIIAWSHADDIYAYDILMEATFAVCTNEHPQYLGRIHGNIVAWTDRRNWDGTGNPQYDIYAYDLPSDREFSVSTNVADEEIVGVDNGRIAFLRNDFTFSYWWGGEGKGYNLYYYDIASSSTVQVTTYSVSPAGQPMIVAGDADFGDGVLTWTRKEYRWDNSNGGWDNAYAPKVSKFVVGSDPSPVDFVNRVYTDWGPSAGGGRAVWADDYGLSDEQLFTWNSIAGVQQVTAGEDAYDSPAIGPDYIVCKKNPNGPVSWQFLYRSLQTEAESVIQESASVNDWRMDGNAVVWHDDTSVSTIRYAFLGADLMIDPTDISFVPSSPTDTESLVVTVTVHNVSGSATTRDVSVRLYDGDPEVGGVEVGTVQTIVGGISAQSTRTAIFPAVVLPEGERQLFARCSMQVSDNPVNNKASRQVTVEDSDMVPPVIAAVIVAEHGGDGDGVIGDDEQFRVSWTLVDASGIATSTLAVASNAVPLGGNYWAVLGPLSNGHYAVIITAMDADASPESSEEYTFFDVVLSEEITVLHGGLSVVCSTNSIVNLGVFSEDVEPLPVEITIQNDGEQSLTVGACVVPPKYTNSGPHASSVLPAGFTTMLLAPETETSGVFTGVVSFGNSDVDESPFVFTIRSEVKADIDGDGIRDSNERQYFTHLDGMDATSDMDGDRFLDRHEFPAGTDPDDDQSYLGITGPLDTSGGSNTICWFSTSNRYYQVQRSTNLPGGFDPIATNIVATPGTNTFTDTNTPASHGVFYRIELED